jgi:ATP-dependent DNA helicase
VRDRGKTIQCIALIAHLLMQNVSGPFLVVAPLATLPNWVREFEKWLPSRPVLRFHGTAQDREAMFAGPLNPKRRRDADFPFIVTSYETAIRDRAKLQKLGEFAFVIVDEGHRLKNHRCCLISSLKKIKAANRLLLTGTPIQNTLDELWSLLNFVNPQIFDDLSVFQRWFGFRDIGQKTHESDILLEQRKNQTVSKLHEILRPFLLRRVKSDVLSDLPPKREVIVYSGMSKLQEGYANMIEDNTLRETLLRQGIEDGRSLSQTNKQMNHRKVRACGRAFVRRRRRRRRRVLPERLRDPPSSSLVSHDFLFPRGLRTLTTPSCSGSRRTRRPASTWGLSTRSSWSARAASSPSWIGCSSACTGTGTSASSSAR